MGQQGIVLVAVILKVEGVFVWKPIGHPQKHRLNVS
jgi:hypothetical protein